MNISGHTDYVSWLISVTVWAAPVQWTSMQPHHDGVNIVRTEQSQKIFDIMDLFFQQHVCWRAEEKSTNRPVTPYKVPSLPPILTLDVQCSSSFQEACIVSFIGWLEKIWPVNCDHTDNVDTLVFSVMFEA